MRRVASFFLLALALSAPTVGIVGIMAGGEVSRMYQANGHSLNPAVYLSAALSKSSTVQWARTVGSRITKVPANHPYVSFAPRDRHT